MTTTLLILIGGTVLAALLALALRIRRIWRDTHRQALAREMAMRGGTHTVSPGDGHTRSLHARAMHEVMQRHTEQQANADDAVREAEAIIQATREKGDH